MTEYATAAGTTNNGSMTFEAIDDGQKPGNTTASTQLVTNLNKASTKFLLVFDGLVSSEWCSRAYKYALEKQRPWGVYVTKAEAINRTEFDTESLYHAGEVERSIAIEYARALIYEKGVMDLFLYSRKFLLDNFNTLRSFPHFDASSMTEKQFTRLRNIIQKISCTDNHSINTATEVESCMEHFKNKNIDVIFLVSSSTHASRCLREVCNYLHQIDKTEYDPLVCMVPADTSYYGFDASDVIIFEPPHLLRDVKGYAKGRGTSSYALARRWRQLVSTNTGSRLMEQLHAEFDALLKKYE